MRDTYTEQKPIKAITAQLAQGTVVGIDVDLQDFDAATLVTSFGASGDTLSGSVKWDVLLEHSLDDGAGSPLAYEAVGVLDVIGVISAAGVVITVDDPAEDDTSYHVGYVGGRRFLRATLTATGTHTVGTVINAIVLGGHPYSAPVGIGN